MVRSSIWVYLFISLWCVECRAEGGLRTLLVRHSHSSSASIRDVERWKTTLEEAFHESVRYPIKIMIDPTPDEILSYYQTLRVHPSDRLFFYYSGHGGCEHNGDHYLALPKGKLYRTQLRSAICAHQSAAQFIITDACGTHVDQLAPSNIDYVNVVGVDIEQPDPVVLEDLFFWHDGLVEIQSARPGRLAYASKTYGGYFTFRFIGQLGVKRTVTDTNGDDFVTWREIFDHVHVRLSNHWVEERFTYPDGGIEIRIQTPEPILLHYGRSRFSKKPHVPLQREELEPTPWAFFK